MFLEPRFSGQRSGWIEVICGSMFSGKTEELLRRLKRAAIANQKYILFKPHQDDRYSKDEVVSHDRRTMESQVIKHSREIGEMATGYQVVGIDEAQFFDEGIVHEVEELANEGIRVIIAGLDMDYLGVPFGPIPQLLSVAEYVTKVHAICQQCGSLATHSYRKVVNEKQVLLGEKEAYEPRCRVCYKMGNILDFNTGKEE